MENRIRKHPEQHVVISDVRFSNEVSFIKEQGGVLVKVSRGPTPPWYETAIMANNGNSIAREIMATAYSSAHASEWSWVGSKFDYEIDNDGTLDDLRIQVDSILSKIL